MAVTGGRVAVWALAVTWGRVAAWALAGRPATAGAAS
jgi:hypothetical protein